MKKLVILFFSLLVTSHLFAEQVDQNTALRVATSFASGFSSLRSTPSLTLIYVAESTAAGNLRSGGGALFYIYNINNESGFVIVSGDDNTPPVLGYSKEGTFQTENMPNNLKNWLSFYEKEVTKVKSTGYTVPQETIEKWNEALRGSLRTAAVKTISTVNWDQSDPYNNLCPTDATGKRSVTGCIATAMGIAMKYYQWPAKGTGSRTYTTTTEKLRVSANFNVSYDWNNMLNAYTKTRNVPNWTTTQGNAVATLLFHCGVASKMDYTSAASGAYMWDAVDGFINYFGYDKSMYLACRDFYTQDEWTQLLKKELDENRLVLYGGSTIKDEGHEFVFDGYDSDNYFHINWGWGGVANGYFLTSLLQPPVQGIGGNQDGDGFSEDQNALIGLKKAQSGSVNGNELYFPVVRGWTYTGMKTNVDVIQKGVPFTIFSSYIVDYGQRDFSGQIGCFLIDKNGNRKSSLGTFNIEIDKGYAVHDSVGTTFTIDTDIATGDRIQMFYTSDGNLWKKIRGGAGAVTELPVDKSSAVANETIQAQPGIELFSTWIESDITIRIADADIQNVSVIDMSGRIMKNQHFNSGNSEITLPAGNLKAGVYILSVQTSKGNGQYKIIKK